MNWLGWAASWPSEAEKESNYSSNKKKAGWSSAKKWIRYRSEWVAVLTWWSPRCRWWSTSPIPTHIILIMVSKLRIDMNQASGLRGVPGCEETLLKLWIHFCFSPQDQSDTGTSSTLQFSADPQPIQLIFIPFFNNSACLKLHKSFSFTTITPRKSFLTEILSLCTSPIGALKEKTILLNLDEQSPKDEKYESLPQDKPHLITKWSIWEISPRSRGTTRQITYGFYSLGTTDIWPNKQTNMASVLLRGSDSQLAAQSLPGNPALRLAARFSPFLLLAHYHLIRSAWLEARGWNVKSILN